MKKAPLMVIRDGIARVATPAEVGEYARTHEQQRCRMCGCTDDDCRQCIERTGRPCHWAAPYLSSACHPHAWLGKNPDPVPEQ